MVKNPIPAKITELASAIVRLVTTHENKTSSSTQKGHTQAGGAPQAIGTSLSAGTDNGYYARADHVHTVNYSNILNKPTTFTPSTHTHDDTYYTKTEINNILNTLLNNITLDTNGDLIIGNNNWTIDINITKNIMATGNTTTITATILDENNNPVPNVFINFYSD